jgi:hypothetical protein
MAGRSFPRNRVSVHRRLTVESLERREVFSLAPTDAIVPMTAVEDDASASRFDVSGDQLVTPNDVLIVINAMNSAEGKTLSERPELLQSNPKIDVDGDGELTPSDVLTIINFLNSHGEAATGDAANGAANIILPLEHGISSAARLANGNIRLTRLGQTVFDFDLQGNLAGQITLPLQAGQDFATITAIPPDGRWIAGSQYATNPSNGGQTGGPVGLWDTQHGLAFQAIDFSAFPNPGWIANVSDSGVAIVTFGGYLSSGGYLTYRWDAAHGLTALSPPTASGTEIVQGSPFSLANAMSADGAVIVGESGDGAGLPFATRWLDPANPEHLPDLGRRSLATCVSLDGRVIGGSVQKQIGDVGSSDVDIAAVWIDGHLNLLQDAAGNPLYGRVEHIVNDVDRDPLKWVAIVGDKIAFSGGSAQPLNDWLREEYGINLLRSQSVVNAFVDGDQLLLVTNEVRDVRLGLPYSLDQGQYPAFPPRPVLPDPVNRLIKVVLSDQEFVVTAADSAS